MFSTQSLLSMKAQFESMISRFNSDEFNEHLQEKIEQIDAELDERRRPDGTLRK